MENTENAGFRQSRIPHPTASAAPILHEMTESQHNTRSQPSTRLQAPAGIKRPGAEIQPQTGIKRQTLAERAADFGEKSSRSIGPSPAMGMTGMSIVDISAQNTKKKANAAMERSGRGPSSTSSRLPSANSHFGQSTGAGAAHPPAFKQTGIVRRRQTARSRPVTAMGRYGKDDYDEEAKTNKEHNGTLSTHPIMAPTLHTGKHRDKAPMQSQSQTPVRHGNSQRSSLGSLTSRFHHMNTNSLSEGELFQAAGNQAVLRPGNLHPDSQEASASKPGTPSHLLAISQQTHSTGPAKSPTYTCTSRFGSKTALWPHTPARPSHDLSAEMARLDNTTSATMKLSAQKSRPPFMTKDSDMRGFLVLDVEERLLGVESGFSTLKEALSQSLVDRNCLEERAALAANRENDLLRQRDQLEQKILSIQAELDACRQQLQTATVSLEREQRENNYRLEDQAREHRRELDDLRRELKEESEKMQRSHMKALNDMDRDCQDEKEAERCRLLFQIEDIKAKLAAQQMDLQQELVERDTELQQSRSALCGVRDDLERERSVKEALQNRLAEATSTNVELEEKVRTLQAQADFLKSDSRQQSDQFAEMEARMQQALRVANEAQQKLIKEETERRILFNKYQELKGNIRVMCRVRPALDGAEDHEPAIAFPDATTSSSKIDVMGPEEKNSLGVASRKTNSFEFDRVFAPGVHNDEIFDEISQLVQSALDGYNVCIFCYGQTGSGKTYTMSSPDGMIPRATHMIYDTIRRLEEKSWSYTMEGSFVEVYNEELNDLLVHPTGGGGGRESEAKKKLEIRHDEARKTTTVVNCQKVRLDSSKEVESILQRAQSNRSVATTKANERSSRSHSVFILKLAGENRATGERCEGTLNLVDLAGSERLKHSGAEGDRKKETQNINKSLACLGDVVEALGRGAPHVPYRNSKLTHLLQYSLGGNSKTLMFVMISPLEGHLKETLTSLRFATKVHNTHIGTARATKKLRD